MYSSRRSLPCAWVWGTGAGASIGNQYLLFLTPARDPLDDLHTVTGCRSRPSVAFHHPAFIGRTTPSAWLGDRCFRCLSRGHHARECRDQIRCTSCLRFGHITYFCRAEPRQLALRCLGELLHYLPHHLHRLMMQLRLTCHSTTSLSRRPSCFALSFMIALHVLGLFWQERRPLSASCRLYQLCPRCSSSRLDLKMDVKHASLKISPLMLDPDNRCSL